MRVPNLHCECQELKPKVETNTSFLVRRPFSCVHSVKTVGSHLKLWCERGITFIINQSITTGIFPTAWKRAIVSPIFKEDLRTDPNNYRPISVLPVVCKFY